MQRKNIFSLILFLDSKKIYQKKMEKILTKCQNFYFFKCIFYLLSLIKIAIANKINNIPTEIKIIANIFARPSSLSGKSLVVVEILYEEFESLVLELFVELEVLLFEVLFEVLFVEFPEVFSKLFSFKFISTALAIFVKNVNISNIIKNIVIKNIFKDLFILIPPLILLIIIT